MEEAKGKYHAANYETPIPRFVSSLLPDLYPVCSTAYLSRGVNQGRREYMKRLILILVILMVLALFAQSRSPIDIGGMKGDMLFRELANNSTNNSTNNSSTAAIEVNKTINLSRRAQSADISGGEGSLILKDLMNSSNATDKIKEDANLSMWGSGPKAIPSPPDSRSSKNNEIIRMNHLGY